MGYWGRVSGCYVLVLAFWRCVSKSLAHVPASNAGLKLHVPHFEVRGSIRRCAGALQIRKWHLVNFEHAC